MFNLFRKRRAPKPEPVAADQNTGPKLAYVVLAEPVSNNVEAIKQAVSRRLPRITWTEEDDGQDSVSQDEDGQDVDGEGEDGAIVGDLDGLVCGFVMIDAPNPLGPEESFIQAAWWWPDAWQDLEPRKAHCIVLIMGGPGSDDVLHTNRVLSQLTAGVMEATPAIGVIWDLADAVWPKEMFVSEVDEATEKGGDPVLLWVSVKLGPDTQFPGPDGDPATLAMTYGLAAFGLMEIEVRGFVGDPSDLTGTMLDIASYLIDQGPVLGDGDTLGPDEGTKMQVSHLQSTLAPGTMVYRVEMQTTH